MTAVFTTVFTNVFGPVFRRVLVPLFRGARSAMIVALRHVKPVVDSTRAAATQALGRARAAATRALGPLLSRIADELPGERLEGRTIIVGLVTMIVVLGLSASVLGSRGNDWLAPPPAAELTVTGAGSGAPAAKCPAQDPAGAVVQPLEPEVRRHVPAAPAAKHHAPRPQASAVRKTAAAR